MLESPPKINIEITKEDESGTDAWLNLKRMYGHFHYPDDSVSEQIIFSQAIKSKDDAVAILAWYQTKDGPYLYLRSAIRPPVTLTDFKSRPEPDEGGNLWEIPAGLVEESEVGSEGLKRAASRELYEEVGFQLEPEEFSFLGKRSFTCAGISAERIFFLHVEVKPRWKVEPPLDGSPFEKCGKVTTISLVEALENIEQGYIYDAKTEIGIRRLAELLKKSTA